MQSQSSAGDSLFRVNKRRKIVPRKRLHDDDDEATSDRISPPASENESSLAVGIPAVPSSEVRAGTATPSEPASSAAVEIARRRRHARPRAGGVEIFNTNYDGRSKARVVEGSADNDAAEDALTAVEQANNRFAPQTGKKADIMNKHMLAYIDSKMAEFSQDADATDANLSEQQQHNTRTALEQIAHRQPAGMGKLFEIDLGPDTKMQNIARTEAAQRRLEGAEPEETSAGDKSGKKTRLGPDGKPWRSRKRRNSEDLRRDKMVEEVLREARLEIYDDADVDAAEEDDQAADDRIAEQFRREFMDALHMRNNRRRAAKPVQSKPGAQQEKPRGPKLGGSRNARAAMREQQKNK